MELFHAGTSFGKRMRCHEMKIFCAGNMNGGRTGEVEIFGAGAKERVCSAKWDGYCDDGEHSTHEEPACGLGYEPDGEPMREGTLFEEGARNRLLSYADVDKIRGSFDFWMEDNGLPGRRLFLDSGAYSAMTRGAEINLDEYIRYIHEHHQRFFCYAALDVIGDWKATKINVDKMVDADLIPLPTYHQNSPIEVLHEYCERFDYLALGGMVPAPGKKELQAFLDRSFSVIKQYWPKKIHSFGVTSQWVLERYPFFSADSTSALLGGAMGRILLFENQKLRSRHWHKEQEHCTHAHVVDGLHAEGSQYLARRIHNIRVMLQYESYLTNLWKRRGITWND